MSTYGATGDCGQHLGEDKKQIAEVLDFGG
jgi:hypothetical protein